MTDFGDNAINGIVAFWTQYWRRERKTCRSELNMSSLKLTLGILAAGLMLSGCMQSTDV